MSFRGLLRTSGDGANAWPTDLAAATVHGVTAARGLAAGLAGDALGRLREATALSWALVCAALASPAGVCGRRAAESAAALSAALASELLHALFVPRVVFNQLLTLGALRVLLVCVSQGHGAYAALAGRLTRRGRVRARLRRAMLHECGSYGEWRRCAEELDRLEGHERWRDECSPRRCRYYDAELLQRQIDELRRLLDAGDTFSLIFRLRGGLQRINFGLLQEALYARAFAGTKRQVEEYHRVVARALEAVCDAGTRHDHRRRRLRQKQLQQHHHQQQQLRQQHEHRCQAQLQLRLRRRRSSSSGGGGGGSGSEGELSDSSSSNSNNSSSSNNNNNNAAAAAAAAAAADAAAARAAAAAATAAEAAAQIPTDVKLAFFNETRHAYGRTALLLSGGAALGFYHVGLITALYVRRLSASLTC